MPRSKSDAFVLSTPRTAHESANAAVCKASSSTVGRHGVITAARPEIERQQQRVTKLGEESLAIRPDCSIMDIRWSQESSGGQNRP